MKPLLHVGKHALERVLVLFNHHASCVDLMEVDFTGSKDSEIRYTKVRVYRRQPSAATQKYY